MGMTTDHDPLLTVEQVEKRWGLTTVRRMINHPDPAQRLKAMRLGGVYRIRLSWVEEYEREHMVDPNSE
jgi:hypothetical protein